MMGLMAREEPRTATSTRIRTAQTHTTEAPTPARSAARAWTTRLVVLGIVLTALNLRPAITSLGALLEE